MLSCQNRGFFSTVSSKYIKQRMLFEGTLQMQSYLGLRAGGPLTTLVYLFPQQPPVSFT